MNEFDGALDHIFSDSRLTPAARVVALYCINRPDRWKLGPEHIRQKLGIGEAAWKSVRRQLIDTGYMTHFRQRNSAGKMEWVFEFSDIPSQ